MFSNELSQLSVKRTSRGRGSFNVRNRESTCSGVPTKFLYEQKRRMFVQNSDAFCLKRCSLFSLLVEVFLINQYKVQVNIHDTMIINRNSISHCKNVGSIKCPQYRQSTSNSNAVLLY